MARIRIGDMLVKAGVLDELQLQSGLAHQRQWGGRLGDVLVARGFIDEMLMWQTLASQLGLPLVSIPALAPPRGIERSVPLEIAQKLSVFPVARDDRTLTFATSDPNNMAAIDELSFRLGVRVRIVLAPDRELDWAIRSYYQGDSSPCPPPRSKMNLGEMAPPAADDGPMEIEYHGRDAGTPAAEIPRGPSMSSIPSAAATFGQGFVSMSPLPSSGFAPAPPMAPPPAPSPAVSEMLGDNARLLHLLVETCIVRGLFTREEYLQKLRSLGS